MSKMIEIGTNFWNLRASFTFLGGLIDIGNHMSLVRLSTGRFLVIDTCDINAIDKQKISTLTNNGELIDAVIATHPFHTMYFKPFKRMFPTSSIKYYGCPRHLRNLPEIPWSGSLVDSEIMKSWENEGIFLRLPSGSDIDPANEGNHFSCVFVFHAPSKTIHIDDTVMYFDHPGCILRCAGITHGKMQFWDLKAGLQTTKEAPSEFRSFIQGIIDDWDFDNIAAAHSGNKIGGAKAQLRETLNSSSKQLDNLSNKYKSKK
jgi:hypothetical protein